jgi:large subunit ribosomal protein L18
VDAGVEVPHGDDIFPDEDRLSGKHIVGYGAILAEEPEVYKQKFSISLSRGLRPEGISDHFNQVKEQITSSFEKNVKPQKEET